MMQSRRYIFINYENLINIKFKKLEKICNKIFVFVSSDVISVPLLLVQQMQKMGKNVKWITMDKPSIESHFHLSFLMGKLHEKVSMDIEFAILSNDESFDSLINFINNAGRNCIRVKQKTNEDESETLDEDEPEVLVDMIEESIQGMYHPETDNAPYPVEGLTDDSFINEGYSSELGLVGATYEESTSFEVETEMGAKTAVMSQPQPQKIKKTKQKAIEKMAEETIHRLIRSGNRPSEISLLENYILTDYEEQEATELVNVVIEYMKETKDIRLEGDEVVYNF